MLGLWGLRGFIGLRVLGFLRVLVRVVGLGFRDFGAFGALGLRDVGAFGAFFGPRDS